MASTAGEEAKAGCAVPCQTSAPLSPVLCLLRTGPWPARSAKALSCTTALPVTAGEGIWEARGGGRWTWLLSVGQSHPSINACWLDLPVLLTRFSFELADTTCYQGLPRLQIAAILCLLCRVVRSSLCSKLFLTSLSGVTSFWFVGMGWLTVVCSTWPLYSWVGKPWLCPPWAPASWKVPACSFSLHKAAASSYYEFFLLCMSYQSICRENAVLTYLSWYETP